MVLDDQRVTIVYTTHPVGTMNDYTKVIKIHPMVVSMATYHRDEYEYLQNFIEIHLLVVRYSSLNQGGALTDQQVNIAISRVMHGNKKRTLVNTLPGGMMTANQ